MSNLSKQFDPSSLHPNLDPNWKRYTAWVQPHVLLPHQGNALRDQSTVQSIASDIRSGKGLTDPLWLDYDPDSHRARLSEGNHRLHAALATGLSHVPVVGFRVSSLPSKFPKLDPDVDKVHDFLRKSYGPLSVETNYFPQYFHPGIILPKHATAGIGDEYAR